MSRKFWTLAEYDKDLAASFAEEFDLDPFVALLLTSRGCKTAKDVNKFFNYDEEIESPFALKDMEKAVETILKAVDDYKKICIYGDYDADGITATAILYSYLLAIGANVIYYLPSRIEDGYGLSAEAVENLHQEEVDLIITVDNGIAAVDAAARLYELGMKLIVTDHHLPPELLPRAEALINPHRQDDKSSFSDLAGVGVVLKLVAALEGGDYEGVLGDFADLVAIGTVADVVPLISENRFLVTKGIEVLNNNSRIGIKALINRSNIADKEIDSASIAFILAPRINATGRMDDAEKALKLLLTDDIDKADIYAEEIHQMNMQRHQTETEILEVAKKDIRDNPDRKYDKILVVDGEEWHQGVLGIVASRLSERYGRPAIVISRESDGIGRGSGRSIFGFPLFDALQELGDMLIHFGGHALAAGFSIKADKIDDFRLALNEYAKSLPDIMPTLALDFRLHPSQLDLSIIDSLSYLEPFGAENPAPIFGLYRMTLSDVKASNNGKHILLQAHRENHRVFAVKFGADIRTFPFIEGDLVDMAVRLDKNTYMGETKLSVKILDIRFSEWNGEVVSKNYLLYDKIKRNEDLTESMKAYALPDRDFIANVFRFIKEKAYWNRGTEALAYRLGLGAKDLCKLKVALDALCELALVKQDDIKGYIISDKTSKVDLAEAGILKALGYTNS